MFLLYSRMLFICVSVGLIFGLWSCQVKLQPSILRETHACILEEAQAASVGATYTVDDWPEQEWWRFFCDPQLNILIEKALSNNPSVAAAEARIGVALATGNKARAPFFPRLGFETDTTRVHQSQNGIFGILAATDPLYPLTYRQQNMCIDFGYEFDFFKKHQNEMIAAIDQTEVTKTEAYISRLALAISVAQTYFQMQIMNERREIAQKLLSNKQMILALISQRQENGLENETSTNRSKSDVLEVERCLSEMQEAVSLNQIEIQALIAGDFNELIEKVEFCDRLEAFPLPYSLPLDLLAHRPDVWARRWNVESKAHQISAARAAFYPNINLSGVLGFQALNNLPLFAFDSTYGLLYGPALHLPIFEGGALQADLDLRTQEYRIAVADYDSSVLTAMKEVLSALVSLQRTSERYDISKRNEAVALNNLEQARQLQQNALMSRLDLLSFENIWLQTVDASFQAYLTCLQARVALIHALGGGY